MLVRYERQTAKKQTEEGKGKYDHITVPILDKGGSGKVDRIVWQRR